MIAVYKKGIFSSILLIKKKKRIALQKKYELAPVFGFTAGSWQLNIITRNNGGKKAVIFSSKDCLSLGFFKVLSQSYV
jgi:hypothetical protein